MSPVQEVTPRVSSPSDSVLSVTPIEVPQKIALGEYIFYRITQANPKLKSIFGIPGDFNIDFLEHAYSPLVLNRGVKLLNTCNELNGAYAADGYARVIDGLSVFISTFGVGELSAMNGIAGAFAEYSPVLHIVGTTALACQQLDSKNRDYNWHHLVPNHKVFDAPDHNVYKKMVTNISCVQESLDYDMDANRQKIDYVLKTIIQERRPGYLFIPCDVPNLEITSNWLFSEPFSAASCYKNSLESNQVLHQVTNKILDSFYKAKNPSVLSDCLTTRFGAQKQLDSFINILPSTVKLFNSNFGRNVDESKENYVGVYNGNASSTHQVQNSLEQDSDFLLVLGLFSTEMNNGGYSFDLSQIQNVVIVHPDYIRIDEEVYNIKKLDGERLFHIGELVESLTEKFDASKVIANTPIQYRYEPSAQHVPSSKDSQFVSQVKLNDHFNKSLTSNDLFIVETMSFAFGVLEIKFPPGLQYLSAHSWASIGFALPATFGATVAINDLNSTRRIILVQGDGGAQMTAQELSSYIRYHQILPNKPQIYMINNDGYTIERKIKGATRPYNDINGQWKWCDLMQTFGGVEGKTHNSYRLENVEEFDSFFSQSKLKNKNQSSNTNNFNKVQFYEIIAGKFDVPRKVDQMMCKRVE